MDKKKAWPFRPGNKKGQNRNRSNLLLPSLSIKQFGEISLLNWVRSSFKGASREVVLGMGDDAACIKPRPGCLYLLTADLSIEGVHFESRYTTMEQVGYKALASNLSDIAAMGGKPKYYLLTAALPERLSGREFKSLYRGMGRLARKSGVTLIGGDLSSSRGGIYLSITVLGEVIRQELTTRSGARPGDRIFVTGTLGDSAAGLELLKKRLKPFSRGGRSGQFSLMRRHLFPKPRLLEGRLLAYNRFASAMIDLSDGLGTDLRHICRESGVRAEIEAERLPFSNGLRSYCRSKNQNPLSFALTGGEDFELLFTVPSQKVPPMERLFKREGIPITEIGRIRSGSGLWVKSTKGLLALRETGFEHFL